MLDLIEAVARLEKLATEHADQFELLAGRVTGLAQDFNRTAAKARATEQQMGRVARLLVELADDHQRIEGLEERVGRLERKAG
jgi:predicted RNase H-like nuclease (RuvC/YqgF family)